MRKLPLLIVLVAAAGGVAWWRLSDKQAAAATEWRTSKVERGDLVVEVTATGTLQPVTQVQVGTQVTGTVLQLFADFNSRVKKDQVVAQIDPASFKAKVDSDRANLDRSKADVTRVQALLVQAERDLERNAALVKDGLVTQQEYDAAVANRDSLKAQVDVSKASVVQQQATLAMSDVNLQYTTITSPIDGIVVSRNVDRGQTVSASLSAPTIFVIAADLKRMQVQAAVAEADIGRVVMGQKVHFTVDAFQGQTFDGSVSQVRLAPTTVQNVVTYTVLVDAPNPDEKLLPGMTANLNFEIDRADDVLLVADSALRFEPGKTGEADGKGWSGGSGGGMSGMGAPGGGSPGGRSGSPGGEHHGEHHAKGDEKDKEKEKDAKKQHVYVLRDAEPVAVDVQAGISDGLRTAIVGGELKEGDEVITGVMPTSSSSSTQVTNPFMPSRPPGGGGRPRM
jgi:HlyD family secretion protein